MALPLLLLTVEQACGSRCEALLPILSLRGLPDGLELSMEKQATIFGIPTQFKEDFVRLFDLLANEKIKPAIFRIWPLLACRRSQELIDAGRLKGKIVLLGGKWVWNELIGA